MVTTRLRRRRALAKVDVVKDSDALPDHIAGSCFLRGRKVLFI